MFHEEDVELDSRKKKTCWYLALLHWLSLWKAYHNGCQLPFFSCCFSAHSLEYRVWIKILLGVVWIQDGVETSSSSTRSRRQTLENTSHEKGMRMDSSDDEAFSVTKIAAASVIGPQCQANPWPTVVPSHVYIYGFNQTHFFTKTYPEFEWLETITLKNQSSIENTTKHDVLVMGPYGPPPTWLFSFPGMIFHINGEPFGGELWERYLNSKSSQQHESRKVSKLLSSALPLTEGSVAGTPSHPPPRNLHLG